MRNNEEKIAKGLNEALEQKGKVDDVYQPYLRMAKALEADASEKQGMDSSVMKEQKMHLLQMAKNLKESNMQEESQNISSAKKENKAKNVIKRPWYIWAGGLAVAAVVVLVVFVSQTGPLPFGPMADQESSFMGKAKLSVLIPAVHAGDAFTIFVDKGDEDDAAVDTSFKIESKVDVDANDLQQSLRIVSVAREQDGVFVDFDIKKSGDKEYTVTPKKDLDPGEVYKVSIAAAVEGDGEKKPREFSWAIQTQDTFRVLRSVPGNKTSYVPVNTSIEVTMSKTGWEDVDDFFTIQPQVAGRFETHGRTIVFVPNKPLNHATIYTVTYKKGWGIKDGPGLENDVVIHFETEAKDADSGNKSYFNIYNYVFESSLANDVLIPVSASEDLDGTNVKLTGYSVTMETALEMVKELESIPYWAYLSKEKSTVLQDQAKQEVFSLETALENSDNYWQSYVRLPAETPKGWYVVKIQPAIGDPSFVLLQRTDVAAYTMVDRDQIIVWAVNRDTAKPLTNLDVALGDQKLKTDNMGVAKFKTPQKWAEYLDNSDKNWDDTTSPSEVMMVGSSQMGVILSVKYIDWYWGYGRDSSMSGKMKYWSYLFPDRPLYGLTDEMNAFGFLQTRDKGEGAGVVQLEFRSNDIDYSNYKQKVLARVELTTDDEGFFEGKLAWSVPLTPGYYNVTLVKDGEDIEQRNVEVRDIVKPAYSISVITDKKAVYAGEQIRGNIKSEFFDGTPYGQLQINFETYGQKRGNEVLLTDDNGLAYFDFSTEPLECTADKERVNCSDTKTISLDARPVLGEEGDIVGQDSVTVWRGRQAFDSWSEKSDTANGAVKLRVREVNLNQSSDEGSSVYGDGVSGAVIESEIFEVHWDRVESGTWYDPIEKKVNPSYRYNQRFESIGKFTSRTDASGEAILSFPMNKDINYRVLSTYLENGKIKHADMTYVYSGYANYSPYNNFHDEYLTLESTGADKDKNEYSIGEEVSLRFVKNKVPFNEGDSTFLFIKASRGIQAVTQSTEASYKFNFTEKEMPNVAIYGVAYTKNGFEQTQYHASLKKEDRELNVELSTDKDKYAPGAQIKVRAKVTDKDGNSVQGARVAVSVVDEALLAVASRSSDPNTLANLYSWVSDGVLASNWSHQYEENGPGGGAEMGGGEGLGAIRKDFKNTAAFMVMETDYGGTAEQTFTAPDNITSWRMTAAALTENHYAGQGRINVSVTKPVFVDAVVPRNLLVSDKPVIKIRAHGAALPSQGGITYVVDIPTLGINDQEVVGEAYEPVYLAVDNLVKGKHKAIIGVKAGGKVDAIEREIEVIESRATHEERMITELAPGVTLTDPGVSSEIRATFESKAKAIKRADVWNLANPWSARLESQLAGVMMRKLYLDYYGEDIDGNVDTLLAYQQVDGGLSILPYASSEVYLSSKAAGAYSGAFDTSKLINYFWTISDDEDVSREESIDALAGLAALGQPVLERLRVAAAEEDLSWREELALMRGLEESGDREASRKLLDSLIAKAEVNDNQMRLAVSDDVTEEIEATVQAAAMASVLAHPDAEKMMAYVDSVWTHEAMTDLDRAIYLEKIVPTLADVNVKISYAIGEQVLEVDLSEWAYHTVTLLPDEVKQFRVLSVNGPAAISFLRRVEGDIKESSPLLGVDRNYTKIDGDMNDLNEGDMVKVNLKVNWDPRAQDGCYIVRDRLPGTLVPIVTIRYGRWNRLGDWYPQEINKGEISFVVCKSDKPVNINYTARVVSLGTYSTNGAIIQSMQVPGLAATSESKQIIVK
ncbi:MAG: Ig-like domain-containing protein [Patescibacteria group bacterium]|nr:Ig-like domain-containing protein [Patescibacteria group bacterium]